MKVDESARIGAAFAAMLVTSVLASWLAGSAAAVASMISGGVILGLLFLLQDDEPREESSQERVIEAPQHNFEDMLDAVADPLILLGESRVLFANGPAKAVLGRHVEGQDLRLAMRHPAVAALLGKPGAAGTVEISGIGGKPLVWEVRVAPVLDGLRLVHMVDMSARHAAERARVDFVANASHELRTPLANISGFVETLTDDSAGGDEDTRQRFLAIIASETKRLSALVEDLMSLSRIEADKGRLPETVIDLVNLVQRTVKERRQSILVDIKVDFCPVNGDTAQLSQLLHNLIDNAFKYGKADGEVMVSLTAPSAAECQLTVIDQGLGIAAEHLPRLTERFYRVDTARSQSAGGTGLGLSIVKHIAERHLGQLEITSEIGKGTCVSLTLPRAKASSVT